MPEDVSHQPVLLPQTMAALAVRSDGLYVDGTFGRGGHAAALLQRLGPAGRLYAFDRDPAAVAVARRRFGDDPRFHIEARSFADLGEWGAERGLAGRIAGVMLDLGVSSPQLDTPERGFSFLREGPLDMRMDTRQGETAAQWLAVAPEQEIARVLRSYGEERFAGRIARAIVRRRARAPLRTTTELAELVAASVPARERHRHPATRTFQALRIQVNRELEALAAGLEGAVGLLAPGGRLAVISFHSLEDRLVKQFIRDQSRGEDWPRGLPLPGRPAPGRLRPIGSLVRPDAAETARNPRARSARLRVAERRP